MYPAAHTFPFLVINGKVGYADPMKTKAKLVVT
jgi:hypothetical protein